MLVTLPYEMPELVTRAPLDIHTSTVLPEWVDWNGHMNVGYYQVVFDLAADARERANKALLEPRRLEAMRHAYEAWSATMPPIAPDAWVGFPHRAELLANPS